MSESTETIYSCKFISFYNRLNKLTLESVFGKIVLECDREQYNIAKNGNRSLVRYFNIDKYIEIVFK